LSLEFSTVTLGDIVSLVIDYRGKTPKKLGSDWSEKGIRALSAKNIKTGNIIREDTIRYVDEELYKKWMKDEIKRNDIIITSEAPFGEVFFWNSDEKIVLSQRLFGVRCNPEIVNPKFIYFYMTSDEFQWELQSRATGTTVKGLRQPELLKCEIKLPNFTIQKKISYLLSNIEDKIDCLKELNKNLQTFSKNIFKYYLEDFTPFISDKMIDSEIGSIPKNWEVYEFDSIAKIFNGYSYKGNELQHSNSAMITIKNFNRDGSFRTDGFKEIVYSDKVKKQHFVNENDVLISCTDVTQDADIIGNCILLLDKQGYNDIIMSMDLVKVESKISGMNNFLLASILKSYRFKMHILGYVNGTTVLHLDKKGIKKFKLALPNDLSILKDLNSILENNYNQIAINQKEIINLEKLRDTLLPKLMSGKIDVSKINCYLE